MSEFSRISNQYKISLFVTKIIYSAPLPITLFTIALIVLPRTKELGFWLRAENHPIEILTFIFLFVGGLYGLYNSLKSNKLPKTTRIFYGIFSLLLLVVAMEEIAWGQWFFHFETPPEWAKINRQGETTIHNLEMMGGHNEILRLIFGVGGLIGIFVSHKSFRQIRVSHLLLPWFVIITFLSVLDFLEGEKLLNINNTWNQAISSSSELTELLIGISSFFYVFFNFRFLKTSKDMLFNKITN